jgi:hypothetical protein
MSRFKSPKRRSGNIHFGERTPEYLMADDAARRSSRTDGFGSEGESSARAVRGSQKQKRAKTKGIDFIRKYGTTEGVGGILETG